VKWKTVIPAKARGGKKTAKARGGKKTVNPVKTRGGRTQKGHKQ